LKALLLTLGEVADDKVMDWVLVNLLKLEINNKGNVLTLDPHSYSLMEFAYSYLYLPDTNKFPIKKPNVFTDYDPHILRLTIENKKKAEVNAIKDLAAHWLNYRKLDRNDRIQYAVQVWESYFKKINYYRDPDILKYTPVWLVFETENLIRLGEKALPILSDLKKKSRHPLRKAVWQSVISSISGKFDKDLGQDMMREYMLGGHNDNFTYLQPIVHATNNRRWLEEELKKTHRESPIKNWPNRPLPNKIEIWVNDLPFTFPTLGIDDPDFPVEEDLPPIEPAQDKIEINKENNGF